MFSKITYIITLRVKKDSMVLKYFQSISRAHKLLKQRVFVGCLCLGDRMGWDGHRKIRCTDDKTVLETTSFQPHFFSKIRVNASKKISRKFRFRHQNLDSSYLDSDAVANVEIQRLKICGNMQKNVPLIPDSNVPDQVSMVIIKILRVYNYCPAFKYDTVEVTVIQFYLT